jgi:hypothetical protein
MTKILTEKVNYNHNRPFLVVDMYHKPTNNARTHKKGWGDESSNWTTMEHPLLVDRISDKQLRRASVIIDINNKSFLKNRFVTTPAQEIYQHFTSKYAEHIKQAVDLWNIKQGIAKAEAKVAEAKTITVTI